MRRNIDEMLQTFPPINFQKVLSRSNALLRRLLRMGANASHVGPNGSQNRKYSYRLKESMLKAVTSHWWGWCAGVACYVFLSTTPGTSWPPPAVLFPRRVPAMLLAYPPGFW